MSKWTTCYISNLSQGFRSLETGESCKKIGVTLIHCWWRCKMDQPFWKTVWKFLKILNIKLPYDPAISLLVKYQMEMKIHVNTKTCTRYVHGCVIPNSPRGGKIQMSINWWMDKQNVFYPHSGIVFGDLKRNEVLLQQGWTSRTLC